MKKHKAHCHKRKFTFTQTLEHGVCVQRNVTVFTCMSKLDTFSFPSLLTDKVFTRVCVAKLCMGNVYGDDDDGTFLAFTNCLWFFMVKGKETCTHGLLTSASAKT